MDLQVFCQSQHDSSKAVEYFLETIWRHDFEHPQILYYVNLTAVKPSHLNKPTSQIVTGTGRIIVADLCKLQVHPFGGGAAEILAGLFCPFSPS